MYLVARPPPPALAPYTTYPVPNEHQVEKTEHKGHHRSKSLGDSKRLSKQCKYNYSTPDEQYSVILVSWKP